MINSRLMNSLYGVSRFWFGLIDETYGVVDSIVYYSRYRVRSSEGGAGAIGSNYARVDGVSTGGRSDEAMLPPQNRLLFNDG